MVRWDAGSADCALIFNSMPTVILSSFRHSGRITGKPEITREQAGVARKWQVGGLRAECFSQFSLSNLWDTVGIVCGLPDSEREHFRTINVQWIGQWGLFSRCGTF